MPKTSATGKAVRSINAGPSRGFTLIEMTVVLAIVALLAGSIPLVLNRALPTRRVTAAADRLLADIRRMHAASTSAGQPASIAPLQSGYRLSLPNDSKDGEQVTFAQSTQLQLVARDDGRALDRFTVFPDGTGAAVLFEISDSGRSARIQTDVLTGRARRIP